MMDDEQAGRAQARQERTKTPAVSRCFPDGTIIELLYRSEERRTQFSVWRGGKFSIEGDFKSEVGERLVPFSPENNLIRNEAVLLPSEPREYRSEQELLSDIQSFIRRYTDLSSSFEKLATHYVLLSWVYDAFNELPYLRLRGDFGTGKTRALLTIGSICYKPFFASGASTVSPIFHTLDAFRGTLIFDEADFRFSDERSEIVKILNNGNVRGLPVLRTMMNRQREFNPQAFQVFGPKIVATRSSYEDKGLESRFLTEEMGRRRLRKDIPINLPASFKDEAREIRDKLLLYRFRNRFEVSVNDSLIDPTLDPRTNQIILPLLSVVRDPAMRAEFQSVARGAHATLIAERGLSPEAHVLEALSRLMIQCTGSAVALRDVVAEFVRLYGSEYDRPISNRWIGGILRRRLNVSSFKSHGVYVVPVSERARIALLCERFGVDCGEDASVDIADGGVQ